ncbi:hypothetical protein B0T22DRAFT_233174 [Podospora appendiculata]|uniref:Uncharacterized protein n=1 Tax=Podospora appendiculata TaxID=314037 RepID=A0AAE1CAU3_9PEZI|nr:hypothetical protein B0T22DRAFT_233174 [Podospora appendiculata]
MRMRCTHWWSRSSPHLRQCSAPLVCKKSGCSSVLSYLSFSSLLFFPWRIVPMQRPESGPERWEICLGKRTYVTFDFTTYLLIGARGGQNSPFKSATISRACSLRSTRMGMDNYATTLWLGLIQRSPEIGMVLLFSFRLQRVDVGNTSRDLVGQTSDCQSVSSEHSHGSVKAQLARGIDRQTRFLRPAIFGPPVFSPHPRESTNQTKNQCLPRNRADSLLVVSGPLH